MYYLLADISLKIILQFLYHMQDMFAFVFASSSLGSFGLYTVYPREALAIQSTEQLGRVLPSRAVIIVEETSSPWDPSECFASYWESPPAAGINVSQPGPSLSNESRPNNGMCMSFVFSLLQQY